MGYTEVHYSGKGPLVPENIFHKFTLDMEEEKTRVLVWKLRNPDKIIQEVTPVYEHLGEGRLKTKEIVVDYLRRRATSGWWVRQVAIIEMP